MKMTNEDYLEAGYVKWQYDHDEKIREEVATEKKSIPIAPIVIGAVTGVIHGTILNGLTRLLLASKKDVTQG